MTKVVVKPKIEDYQPLALVGVKAIIRHTRDAINSTTQLPALWQELLPIAAKLPNRIGGERYALITGDLPHDLQDQACYYALVAVEDFAGTPDTLIRLEIPQGRIAKFVHRGPPQSIGEIAGKAFFEWLPGSGESISENMELFVYPDRYDRSQPDAQLDYCLFLNSKVHGPANIGK